MFTPQSRRALAALLQLGCATARWVRQHIPVGERLGFVGGILFRIEGSLVRRRVLWEPAVELRRLADVECNPPCPDAAEIMALLRADLPLLNEVRAHGH